MIIIEVDYELFTFEGDSTLIQPPDFSKGSFKNLLHLIGSSGLWYFLTFVVFGDEELLLLIDDDGKIALSLCSVGDEDM